jgi:hypothetical protein
MSGYTKLLSSLLDSTIWRESKETRLVWITMLAMADRDGFVWASVPGLADRAKVPLDGCLAALKALQQPDEWSRSKEYEGRRIEQVDEGWRLLNHAKYREKMSAEDNREKNRLRQAGWRERHPEKTKVLERSKLGPGESAGTRRLNAGHEPSAAQIADDVNSRRGVPIPPRPAPVPGNGLPLAPTVPPPAASDGPDL